MIWERLDRILSAYEAALRSQELVNTATYNRLERMRVQEEERAEMMHKLAQEVCDLRYALEQTKSKVDGFTASPTPGAAKGEP